MSQISLLRYVVLALQRQGARQLNLLLAEHGLTASQAEVLSVVGTYGPVTIKEVGAKLICESGSPSRLVNGLIDRGLIVRSSLPHDKRASLLALSPSGRDLLEKVREVEGVCEAQLLEEIPGDQVIEVTRVLRRCVREESLDAALTARFPSDLQLT